MVYCAGLVVAVQVSGKSAREVTTSGDTKVHLPFGTDYSLLFKNTKPKQRAVVSVSIDGKDVLGGSRIVVPARGATDLKGFLDDDGVRDAFRVIEKTKEVSEHLGNDPEDGLIRVEWQFEVERKPFIVKTEPLKIRIDWDDYWTMGGPVVGSAVRGFTNNGMLDEATFSSYSSSRDVSTQGMSKNESVVTARGGDVHQDFESVSVDYLEPEVHVAVIQLFGKEGETVIKKPILTRVKLQCPSCGKSWSSTHKFCGSCSTKLPSK